MLINVLQLLLWGVQLAFFGMVDWFRLIPIKELAAVVSVAPGGLATVLTILEGGKKGQRMFEVALGFFATIISWFSTGWWWWLPVALVAIWNCSQVLFFVFVNVAKAAAAIANFREGSRPTATPQATQPQA